MLGQTTSWGSPMSTIDFAAISQYQRLAVECSKYDPPGRQGPLAQLLALSEKVGSILGGQKRYYRNAIDYSENRHQLIIDLGDLLWYIAIVADSVGHDLGEMAEQNLLANERRFEHRRPAKALRRPEKTAPIEAFTAYQARATTTSRFALTGPEGAVAPMFALAAKVGALLDAQKRRMRDNVDFRGDPDLRTDLADLLWYLSAVATAAEIDLGVVAAENCRRMEDLYPAGDISELLKSLPVLDDREDIPPTQRFPRLLLVRFEPFYEHGRELVRLTLIKARPDAFPDGPIDRGGGKLQGYRVGAPLGDELTDNSRRRDGYRFHDAIHLGFLAVLGWSPTLRHLLNLKRKADRETDEGDDGARARFAEEGLAAILAQLAPRREGFMGPFSVDSFAIEMAKAATAGLEVAETPGWAWRPAIRQGFQAMHELNGNNGGYLLANLDERRLTYHKTEPNLQ